MAWAPLALLLLTACPAGDRSAAPAPRRMVTALAGSVPPAVLSGVVDLSAAVGGVPGSATAAVAEPDGGVDVVVVPDDAALPVQVVALDSALKPAGAEAVSHLRRLWDVHGLPGGGVVVSGNFDSGLGFAVVDPRTGTQRDVVVRPPVFRRMAGGSLPSPDGRTVYLLVGDELLAVDVASGAVRADRNLGDDVGAVSGNSLPSYGSWLVPAPAGVGLVFDAWPDESPDDTPAVLTFGPDLEPVPSAGVLTDLSGSVDAVATAADGGLFLTVTRPDGARLLAVPTGDAEASVAVRLAWPAMAYALAVDPWQGWVMTPAPAGVQAVNLVTGGSRRVELGCGKHGTVSALSPGRRPTTVLVAGRCEASGAGTPMLWTVEL